MSNLRLFHTLVVCLLVGTVSVSCTGERSERGGDSLDIKRAIAVGEGPGFRRVARIKLGCAPCSEVSVEHADGDTITYLYSESNSIEIQSSKLSRFYLLFVDEVFVLGVQLDPMSQELILENAESRFDQAANFVSGEFVDVVPMSADGPYYMIGAFESREKAHEVADQLGATTIEESDEPL